MEIRSDQRDFNLFVCQAEDVEFKCFCTRILLYTFSELYYLGVEFSLLLLTSRPHANFIFVFLKYSKCCFQSESDCRFCRKSRGITEKLEKLKDAFCL